MSAGTRLAFAALAVAWLVGVVSASGSATAPIQAGEVTLPEGPGRAAVVTMCSDCHGLAESVKRRHTRTTWRTIVETMAGLGAPGGLQDIKDATAYLARQFGCVNVNDASEDDIKEVLELTAAEAAAVVEFRTHEGELRSLAGLAQVPGLDAGKLSGRAARIIFTGETCPTKP